MGLEQPSYSLGKPYALSVIHSGKMPCSKVLLTDPCWDSWVCILKRLQELQRSWVPRSRCLHSSCFFRVSKAKGVLKVPWGPTKRTSIPLADFLQNLFEGQKSLEIAKTKWWNFHLLAARKLHGSSQPRFKHKWLFKPPDLEARQIILKNDVLRVGIKDGKQKTCQISTLSEASLFVASEIFS